MVRELMVFDTGKPVRSDYTATTAMVTGMGVVDDDANGKVKFPTAATADGLYLVERERIASGIYASVTNMDDYDEHYTKIAAGEFVEKIPMVAGEVYAVDQYASTIVKTDAGKYLAVDTDGKWALAASTVASRYVMVGLVTEGTHTLLKFKVCSETGKNAA